MSSNNIGVPPLTLTASLRVRSQPTSLCRRQPGMNWPSISKPPGRSGSPYRQSCCSPLTRSSNETARVLPCRRGDRVRRREFITLAGVAAVWPRTVRAQGERLRRIGVLSPLAADDPQSQRRMTAFVQALQQYGWTEGRNVTIETRWGGGDAARLRRYAQESIALSPEVIFAVT